MKKEKGIPSEPKPCCITDGKGNYYHPTQAPSGLSKCGVMLDVNPKRKIYEFSSKIRAGHAIEHTIRYLQESGIDVNVKSFIVMEI